MSTAGERGIRHLPIGYYPGDGVHVDRSPRVPTEGEYVIIKAEVPGGVDGQDPVVRYAVNGMPQKAPGRAVVSPQGRARALFDPPGEVSGPVTYHVFELGRFCAGDEVTYTIEAGPPDRRRQAGPFTFVVDGIYRAGTQAELYPVPRGVRVDFGPVGAYHPVLELRWTDGRLTVTGGLRGLPGEGALPGPQRKVPECTVPDEASGGRLVVQARPFHFAVYDREGRFLFGSVRGERHWRWRGTPAGRARALEMELESAAEHYFGFGERFDALDQNGHEPDVCVVNAYIRQGRRTYLPVPFFVTEAGFGLHVESDRYVRFGLAPRLPGAMRLQVDLDPEAPRAGFTCFFGAPADVVRQFTASTGPAAVPPRWAFGPWMSSNPWNTQREVEEQIETTARLDIPATVIVIEAWSDEATYYVFNDAVYEPRYGQHAFRMADFTFPANGRWPDPRGMVERIHARDMRLILWQVPIIKGFERHTCRQHELDEQYVIEQGYCVHNADGTPYRIPDGWFGGSLLLDFTNPKALQWWVDRRRYLVDELGVDGFKTDGGEFVLDQTVRFADGTDGGAMRNRYPVTYVAAYHAFCGRERMTFSRSGFTGAQRFPAYWAGDQVSTFEEFRAVLTAGLSLGLSGNPFWGFDIAGFSGDVPTADLYLRATQAAAFSPIMQYHAESRGKENRDRTPWNMAARTGDERIVPIFRRFAWVRMNLLPYVYGEALHAAAACEPLMRALPIDFPGDREALAVDDEYMFGRALLVAPVLEEHARQRRVYLPEGPWVDLWTLREVPGGWHDRYPADLDTIPVFVRKGAIVPLNLGRHFALGEPTGERPMRYAHLAFLVAGRPEGDRVFRDDQGNEIRFHADGDRLHVEQVSGSLPAIWLLVASDGSGWPGFREGSGRIEVAGSELAHGLDVTF